MKKSEPPRRIRYLDAVKGLAVVLMVEQHFGFWFCEKQINIVADPLFTILNGLGGIAAPLFVVASGMGSVLFFRKATASAVSMIMRGIVTILLGYVLNLATPSWFSAGSWYILHLIGFCLVLSPLLNRIPSSLLIALALVATGIAVVLQTILNTPYMVNNEWMDDFHRPGGLVRLMAAEGHFPVFPWISFFMTGIVAGRALVGNDRTKVWSIVGLLMSIAIALAAASWLKAPHQLPSSLDRVFIISLGFYPAFPIVVLFLLSMALLIILWFNTMDARRTGAISSAMIALGRASLSILIIHIIIGKELTIRIGIWKTFSFGATVLIVAGTIALLAVLCLRWDRIEYRYGAEWAVRQLSGFILKWRRG